MEEDYGYDVDKTIKVVKGKVSKPLQIKLLVKTNNNGTTKPTKVKISKRKKQQRLGLSHNKAPLGWGGETDGGPEPG